MQLINTERCEMLDSWVVHAKSPIKGLALSKNGKHLLVNSTDRKIRLYDIESQGDRPRQQAKHFEDRVNSNQWKCCGLSGDSDYVCAGSSTTVAHNISIWERTSGHLQKILEGPKEGILDLQWHPTRPIIASVSTLGVVYIWGKSYTENWSAFAPDFTELEENEEYIEREDEFDIVEWEKKQKPLAEHDEIVDLVGIDRAAHESDSDEELFFLPTVPDRDEDADSGPSGKVDHPGAVLSHNVELFAEKEKSEESNKRQKLQSD